MNRDLAQASGILGVLAERYTDLMVAIPEGRCDRGVILYLNPSTYLHARSSPDLYARAAALRFDGLFFTFMVRRFLKIDARRQSFDLTSLAPIVLRRAAELGQSVALFGGRPGEASQAAAYLRSRHPGLQVVGSWNGYWTTKSERATRMRQIVRLQPDILVVGLGGVLQDMVAVELEDLGFRGVIHTCGGFISQTAKRGEYYPGWANQWRLRWLYRMIHEPSVLKRVLTRYPLFTIAFLSDCLRRGRG